MKPLYGEISNSARQPAIATLEGSACGVANVHLEIVISCWSCRVRVESVASVAFMRCAFQSISRAVQRCRSTFAQLSFVIIISTFERAVVVGNTKLYTFWQLHFSEAGTFLVSIACTLFMLCFIPFDIAFDSRHYSLRVSNSA